MKAGSGLTPREQLLKELKALPSSFSTYVGQEEQRKIPVKKEADDKFKAGLQAFKYALAAVEEEAKKGHYTEAIKCFEAAIIEAGDANPGRSFETSAYQNIGTCYVELYKITKDIKYLEAAKDNFSKNVRPFMDHSLLLNAEVNLRNMAFIHKENGTIEAYKTEQMERLNKAIETHDQTAELKARLALGGIARVQGNHLEAIEHYAKSWEFFQGQVDYEAHRVEQREVGFSSQQKIGTENIQQCVVLIIRDPETNRTALAHIDIFTDPSSIQTAIFAQFKDKGEGAKPYEVTIVGGRDRLHLQQDGTLTSDANINKVLGALESWGVKHTVKAADIGDKGAPSGIVFDPLTGTLEHAVPGIRDKTTSMRIARLLHGDTSLKVAFDFSQDLLPEAALSEETSKEHIRKAINFTQPAQAQKSAESWNAALVEQTSIGIAKDLPNIMAKVLIEDAIKNIAKKIEKTMSYSAEELRALEAHITKEVSKLSEGGKGPADIYNGLMPVVQNAFKAKTLGEKLKPKNWLSSVKEEVARSVKFNITVPKDVADETSIASATKKSEVISKKKEISRWWRDKVTKRTKPEQGQGFEK